MRVKVGDTWYEATAGQPIMVELTDADKQNIERMLPEATKYAEFDDHDIANTTKEDRLAWMRTL